MNKVMCFLTGGHKFKCGKQFSFTGTYKQFGIPNVTRSGENS